METIGLDLHKRESQLSIRAEDGTITERRIVVRFLPIVLTTLTAIGGLLPIALQGSGLYAPLASVIIGGLVSSPLLGRIVTPVMYQLIATEVR